MARPRSSSLTKLRDEIAGKVRALRVARHWSQAELALKLGLSQNRLSEIERGDGSFTAEQLLVILRLFNVSAAHFSGEPPKPSVDLQNALSRLGASHLHESSSVIPSEQLDQVARVIHEALVDGSSRLVTAVGPVLIRHGGKLNLTKVQAELASVGLERRLPWLIENVLDTIDHLETTAARKRALIRNAGPLRLFRAYGHEEPSTDRPPDVLDPTIRSEKTAEQVRKLSSQISKRWNVITSLTEADFAGPLEAAIVGD